jgi:CheY-like chemotaxis protein
VNQEVAVSMLTRQGYTVKVAGNGEEAVAATKRELFDLVLMDIQMPLMNGYEATDRIRQREKQTGIHTYIIGLTANAMSGDKEKCLQAGMDGYISKPMHLRDLTAAIAKLNLTKKISTDNLKLHKTKNPIPINRNGAES